MKFGIYLLPINILMIIVVGKHKRNKKNNKKRKIKNKNIYKKTVSFSRVVIGVVVVSLVYPIPLVSYSVFFDSFTSASVT